VSGAGEKQAWLGMGFVMEGKGGTKQALQAVRCAGL
jgi:hypothetical protein